eukprot:g8896.t1
MERTKVLEGLKERRTLPVKTFLADLAVRMTEVEPGRRPSALELLMELGEEARGGGGERRSGGGEGAVAAQVFFAGVALVHGIQVDELQGESFDEVVLNVAWIEGRRKGIMAALVSAAFSSGGFLLLLAYFPVHLVVNFIAVGGPAALIVLGGLSIANSPITALLGLEAHLGWPFMMLGVLGLIGTSFAWQYLRLGIAVLRTSAAFIRARPSIGAYPLLFGVVHLSGLCLWALAVFGIRSSFQDQIEQMDWHSQFGTATAMLLCFLWGNAFVTGLSTFAVSYAACHWYHAGSVALGSLLLAFVRTLNVMLWWAEKAQEEATAAASGAVGAVGLPRGAGPRRRPPSLLRSLRNFAAEVLEVVATWASKQAFVQIAISGCPFAAGAMRAGHLAAKAPAGFLMVEALSNVFQRACEFLLICMSLVVASCCGLEGVAGLGPVALSAYLAAESLLHPYSVATTTILHCCFTTAEQCCAVIRWAGRPGTEQLTKLRRGSMDPEAVEIQRLRALAAATAQRLTAKKVQQGHSLPTARPPKRRRNEFLTEPPSAAGAEVERPTRTRGEEPRTWEAAAKVAEAAAEGGGDNGYTVVEIPDDFTGLLIGKQGSMIKNLQAETGAALCVGKLAIEGMRKDAKASQVVDYVELPNKFAGRLIGLQGQVIGQVREAYGVRAYLDQCYEAPMRKLELRGSAEAVAQAKQHVELLLLELYRRHKIYNAPLENKYGAQASLVFAEPKHLVQQAQEERNGELESNQDPGTWLQPWAAHYAGNLDCVSLFEECKDLEEDPIPGLD